MGFLVDERFDYGEERIITMGHFDNRLHVVVYTGTDDTVRIISDRKANEKEHHRPLRCRHRAMVQSAG